MRTNIDIDDALLAQALELSACKTKKDVVRLALTELINKAKRQKLLSLWASNIWEGELNQMRVAEPSPKYK